MRTSLSGLADRLHRLSPISDSERRALCGLWREVSDLSARSQLPAVGEVGFVVSGWACHQRTLTSGRRQIIGFMVPGDPHRTRRDPQADAQAVCLTHVQFVDASALFGEARANQAYPALSQAISLAERRSHDFLIEHIVRLASRDARSGLAHLILELEARTAPDGCSGQDGFALPIGQRPLGHAMGFSTVHVNKTLARLREEGLLEMAARRARVLDRAGLRAVADA